jgi:uncharacterized protein YegP (UPF0339 family)
MPKSVLVVLIGLATAAVGLAQRQPATPGGSSSGTATERKSATKDTNANATNGATTAADRNASAKHSKGTFEVYKDKAGEYRWRLRATNTQILAMAAQGYSDKRSCMNAIESIKRDVADATIEEKEAVAGKDDASSDGAAAKTAGASRSGDSSRSGDASTTGSSGRKSPQK